MAPTDTTLTFGWDTETALIEPGLLAPPLACLSFSDAGDPRNSGVLATDTDAPRAWLADALASGARFVGANVAYDFAVMCQADDSLWPLVFDAYAQGRVRDVLLDQKFLDIARGIMRLNQKKPGAYSLKGVAARYGIELEKDDTPRLEYGRLIGRPISEYTPDEYNYALRDAQVPPAVSREQAAAAAKLAASRGMPDVDILAPGPGRAFAAFVLHLDQCHGVLSDAGRCRTLELALEQKIADASHLLRATCMPYEIVKTRQRLGQKYKVHTQAHGPILRPSGSKNLKVAKAYMRQVCAELGITPHTTATGDISLDEAACTRTGHPVFEALTVYNQSDTLLSRVRDLAYGAHTVLQPAYNPLVDTGRTSCRKSYKGSTLRGFQAQNMPNLPGSRECLQPRPGYIYFGVDVDAAEMHTLAQAMWDWYGQCVLADVLNAGRDPHLYFGAALLEISYEQADAMPDKKKKVRKPAKPGNFGIPGGMGAETFVGYAAGYGVRLDIQQAQRHIATFKQQYPVVAHHLRQVGKRINAKCDWMYYARTGFMRGGLTYTSMSNNSFQSPTAFAVLAAHAEVSRHCYAVKSSPLYGARIWGYIHDEIIGECPVAQAAEAAAEAGRIMREVYNQFVPDVPTGAEPAIFWQWSKSEYPAGHPRAGQGRNDPLYGPDGKLVPSDPENAPHE